MADQSGRRNDAPNQVTACRRCRKQKLRCSRETPSCKRCDDISAVCAYPPPPDRKLLAAQRAQNVKARALRVVDDKTSEYEHESSPTRFKDEGPPHSDLGRGMPDNQPAFNFSLVEHAGSSASVESPAESPSMPAVLRQVPFPTREIALLLAEVYFSRLHNASLLFHKQTFLTDLESRSLPDFIFLSVFALASIFLRKPPTGVQVQAAELGIPVSSLVDCSRLAFDWAVAASQQALMNADQPRHETIQACLNLGIYWFSMEEMDRANIHTGLAYRTCRLLGYHVPPAAGTEIDVLYGETKRRCFWACWITNCIAQENASFKLRSWEEAAGLPLPSDEASFSVGNPKSKEKFDDQGRVALLIHGSAETTEVSFMGEMVKLYGMWWEIQRFAKQYAKVSNSVDGGSQTSMQRFSRLQELDEQLETIRDNFHQDLKYPKNASFTSLKVDPSQLFSLHCIYHLCACALHSSIVTLFSNIKPDPNIPKKVTRMSAEEAVDHSRLLMDLASAYVANGPEKSRLPSLVGYAMFVASTIQFKSLGAQGKLRDHSLARLQPAISILDELKEYWRPLRAMWRELDLLFHTVGADINHLSSLSLSAALPDTATNIDQIVKHPLMLDSTGGGSMYSYVRHEEISPATSRRPSGGLPLGPKMSSSLGAEYRSSENKKRSPKSRYSKNDTVREPIPLEQGTQIYHGQQPTVSIVQSQMIGMPENYGMSPNIPSEYISVENAVRGSRAAGIEYSSIMEGMASTVESTMVIEDDGMHDTASALWWEHSFHGLPVDPNGFLIGPYSTGPESGYYRTPT